VVRRAQSLRTFVHISTGGEGGRNEGGGKTGWMGKRQRDFKTKSERLETETSGCIPAKRKSGGRGKEGGMGAILEIGKEEKK